MSEITPVEEFDIAIYDQIIAFSGRLTPAEMIGVLSVRLGDIQVRRIVQQMNEKPRPKAQHISQIKFEDGVIDVDQLWEEGFRIDFSKYDEATRMILQERISARFDKPFDVGRNVGHLIKFPGHCDFGWLMHNDRDTIFADDVQALQEITLDDLGIPY